MGGPKRLSSAQASSKDSQFSKSAQWLFVLQISVAKDGLLISWLTVYLFEMGVVLMKHGEYRFQLRQKRDLKQPLDECCSLQQNWH